MLRIRGGILAVLVAAVAAVGVATFVLVPSAQGASAVKVCGSGFGHGVGLSQYGAYGRAKAGQNYAQIVKTYYRGVSLNKYSTNPGVRVLLGERALSGSQDIVVGTGSQARLRNLATGGTISLGAGTYRVQYLTDKKLYRVANLSTGRVLGSYQGPIRFEPVTGFLRYGGKAYRGLLTVQAAVSKLLLVNQLPIESYVQGVLANEMPSSWPAEALKSQAIASRSHAKATHRSSYYDLTSSDQRYNGVSSETAATNGAAAATAGIYATYNGSPIKAFFSAANGGYSEDAAYVFGTTPYLKAFRDVDGAGRAYEGTAYARSPWTNWYGALDANGSPELGIGSITGVRVIERSPSGRATKVEVSGTKGRKIVYGEYEIRYRLDTTGLRRADGSSYPPGHLPSARVSFGAACG